MFVHPAAVAALSAAYLYLTGDGVCTWLLGLRPAPRAARVALAMGASLAAHLLLGAAPYLAGLVPSAAALVPWLPAALLALTASGWIWAPRRAAPPPALPLRVAAPLVAAALAASAVLLSPAAAGEGGFYYSNNGEFSSYAAIADFVSDHGVAAPMDLPVGSARTREGAVAVVCAVVARALHVPPLFVVQPLSAVFAAIFFLGVATLLAAASAGPDATRAGAALAALLFAAFVLSSSTQQLWTASFLSQYLSFAVLGAALAWLPWAELPARSDAGRAAALAVLVAAAVAAVLLAYPEMAPIEIGFVALFAFARRRLGWRHLAAAALGATLLVLAVVPAWRLGVERLDQRFLAGFDLYGSSDDPLLLASNLLGSSNEYWDRTGAEPLALAAFALLVLGALARASRAVRAEGYGPRCAPGAALAVYLAATAALFARVTLAGHPTNYVAAKFAATFLWVPALAVASAVIPGVTGAGSPPARRRLAWAAATAVVLALAAAQLRSGALFTRGLLVDAAATRLGPSDLAAARRLIPPGEDVALLTPDHPKYKLDALYLWKGRAEADAAGRILGRPEFRYRGQRWVITTHLHEDGRIYPFRRLTSSVPVWERGVYAILRRD